MDKLRTSKIIKLTKNIETKRNAVLKTYKLSVGQDLFLNVLLKNHKITMGQIAEKIDTAPPSTTKYATRLENLGLITREPSKLDSRHFNAKLTSTGIETIKAINLAYIAIDKDFHKGLKSKDNDRLDKLLWKLTSIHDGKISSNKKPKKAGKNKDTKKSKENKKKTKKKN